MPGRQKQAAPEAQQADVNSAGVQAPEGIDVAEIESTLIDALTAAPEAELPEPTEELQAADVPTTALQDATAAVAEIEVALGAATNPRLRAVLESELAEAIGALALAEAEAEHHSAYLAEIAEAEAAVSAIVDPHRRQRALDAMLAAIEIDFDMVPAPEADETVEAAPAPVTGKQVGARMAAVNAATAADPLAEARGSAYLSAFDNGDAAEVLGVTRDAGTRYPSLVALARKGAGVVNRVDYASAVSAVRFYMRTIGHSGKGNGAADNNWLLQRGPHAAGAYKAGDCLPFKFRNGMRLALYADGMFRLAASGTAGVRFVDSDAAAWQQWSGSHTAAPEAQQNASAASGSTATVPTPPNVQANAYGSLTPVANCAHCGTRNVSTAAICRTCKSDAWQAEAGA